MGACRASVAADEPLDHAFGGKADQLNAYYFAGGGPDFYAEDLARYMSLSPTDIQAAVRRWLPPDRRVELIVEPATAK